MLAIHKEALYGTLDPTTREWNDGLFTHILCKIVDDVRGERSKRHWIIFDGDVDSEWVENLNSVLDDNKLLTLPNGPPNVRIMFEVEHLRYATLATISRCGMIWFSEDVVVPDMVYDHYIQTLRSIPLDEDDENSDSRGPSATADNLAPAPYPTYYCHYSRFTTTRALNTLFSLLNKTVRNVIDYNNAHSDFPLVSRYWRCSLSLQDNSLCKFESRSCRTKSVQLTTSSFQGSALNSL